MGKMSQLETVLDLAQYASDDVEWMHAGEFSVACHLIVLENDGFVDFGWDAAAEETEQTEDEENAEAQEGFCHKFIVTPLVALRAFANTRGEDQSWALEDKMEFIMAINSFFMLCFGSALSVPSLYAMVKRIPALETISTGVIMGLAMCNLLTVMIVVQVSFRNAKIETKLKEAEYSFFSSQGVNLVEESESLDDIFENFIEKCFKRKKATVTPSPDDEQEIELIPQGKSA
jgi:hypothetical protein